MKNAKDSRLPEQRQMDDFLAAQPTIARQPFLKPKGKKKVAHGQGKARNRR